MVSKHFENEARRAWWSVHIEAWRRSGLSRKRYCQKHRLCVGTFGRWLAVIGDAIALQHQARSPRKPRRSRLCTSKRSIGVQAFWAMHVEAMTWSGSTATHYAAAHHISAISLRRWRDLLESGEVEVDWRAHLHPSARPPISTSAKLDFGQNLNGLAIVRGAKHGVHQFLYGHGQAETVRKIAVVSVYPANALSSALSKLAKVELRVVLTIARSHPS